MRRFALVMLWSLATISLAAQRLPVLKQIQLPHNYYYREMYLPQLTSGPGSVAWIPKVDVAGKRASDEAIFSMQARYGGSASIPPPQFKSLSALVTIISPTSRRMANGWFIANTITMPSNFGGWNLPPASLRS